MLGLILSDNDRHKLTNSANWWYLGYYGYHGSDKSALSSFNLRAIFPKILQDLFVSNATLNLVHESDESLFHIVNIWQGCAI